MQSECVTIGLERQTALRLYCVAMKQHQRSCGVLRYSPQSYIYACFRSLSEPCLPTEPKQGGGGLIGPEPHLGGNGCSDIDCYLVPLNSACSSVSIFTHLTRLDGLCSIVPSPWASIRYSPMRGSSWGLGLTTNPDVSEAQMMAET